MVNALAPSNPMKRGFTLIELLIVIAIIAILAAILFPVFASAREKARQTSCLNNEKQMGMGIMQYTNDFDDTLPAGYGYGATGAPTGCNGGPGGATNCDATGIVQWSYLIQPYVKSNAVFVCPSDKLGGLPPTNFTDPNSAPPGIGTGTAGVQDLQVPRLSYTCNEQIMPRPRGGVMGFPVGATTPQRHVQLSLIDAPASTIAITEFTDYPNAISSTGGLGGNYFKSHRPSDALMLDTAGTAYDTNGDMTTGGPYAVSAAVMQSAFIQQPTVAFGGASLPHIVYINSGRHSGGNNFIFADGHAKWYRPINTISCSNFLWGTRTFNEASPRAVLCADGSNTPVK